VVLRYMQFQDLNGNKMGIQNFIRRRLNQKAAYWGNPQEDGYGGKLYDDPIEIDCRWEDTNQIILMANGEELLSRAIVFTEQDLEENGLLYLGTLDDLLSSSGDSSGDVELTKVEGVHIIKRYEKIPSLRSDSDFLRKSYLTPFLT
jgi:hypothetical protein